MSSSSLRRGTKRQYCLHLYTPRLEDIVNKIPTLVSATALFAATAANGAPTVFDGCVRRTTTSRTFAWYAAKTAVADVNAGSDALSSATPAVTTLLASATSSAAAMKNVAELAFALPGSAWVSAPIAIEKHDQNKKPLARCCRAHSTETALSATVTLPAAVVLMLWCALTTDARAAPLERVEFESASQRLVSDKFIPGDRIQGYLAKPDGAGAFPAVVGLHGCAGMHDTTKQRLADELVARLCPPARRQLCNASWHRSRLHIERVCHLRQAQAGCLRGSRLPGAPKLRRSTTRGRGRLLCRRLGHPLRCGDQFVRTVRR